MGSVPALLFGKSPDLSRKVIQALLPQIDVIHVCLSIETGLKETPFVITGQTVKPASGLGSNIERDDPLIPKIAITGAGFTEEEVEAALALQEANKVVWFIGRISRSSGSGPPPADIIAGRLKSALAEHGGIVESSEAPTVKLW